MYDIVSYYQVILSYSCAVCFFCEFVPYMVMLMSFFCAHRTVVFCLCPHCSDHVNLDNRDNIVCIYESVMSLGVT